MDVENDKSNNPGIILVGIRFTDKKAPSPYWRKTPHNYASSSSLKKILPSCDHKGNGAPLLTPSSLGAAGRNSGGEDVFVEFLIAAAALSVW